MSWAQFQALRHHHLLRDFPSRILLQDHLLHEGVDPDAIHSTLAWRDGISDAVGHQFVRDDGTYMPLYEAWVHGSELMRRATHRKATAYQAALSVEELDAIEEVPF